MNKVSVFGKSNNKIYKVFENNLEEIWDYSNISNFTSIDFMCEKGSYHLNDDEIFFISLSDEEKLKINDLLISTNANNIDKRSLLELNFLFIIKEKSIYFQRIFKSNLINKPYISFSDVATLHTKKTILVIQDRTEVAFVDGKVYFFKFSDLTAIFNYLSHYYREATKEDLRQFSSHKKINIKTDLKLEKLPKTILQKIAQIVDNFTTLEQNFKTYQKYSADYVNIFNNQTIEISNKKDIEELHNLIFQKYYKSVIGSEKRLANSFKKL